MCRALLTACKRQADHRSVHITRNLFRTTSGIKAAAPAGLEPPGGRCFYSFCRPRSDGLFFLAGCALALGLLRSRLFLCSGLCLCRLSLFRCLGSSLFGSGPPGRLFCGCGFCLYSFFCFGGLGLFCLGGSRLFGGPGLAGCRLLGRCLLLCRSCCSFRSGFFSLLDGTLCAFLYKAKEIVS